MRYTDWLGKNKECPFCELENSEIIKGSRYAVLTLAQAPYGKDHLIVTCRRHVTRLDRLKRDEKRDIEKLIGFGMKDLHKKYTNITLLYREGNPREVGKSIEHLHYHLIPNLKVGVFGVKERRIWGDGFMRRMIRKFRKRFGGK